MRRTLMILPAALALVGARSAEPSLSELPALLSMEPLSVPIVDAGRVEGTLDVKLVLQGRDSDTERLDAAAPVLRGAIRAALAEHARLYASPWQAVDTAALTQALHQVAEQASPAVRAVLVTEVRARRA